MNAIAELSRLPETKSQRESFVSACIEEILSGIHNPLNVTILLKNLEETIKSIRENEQVKEAVMFELNKYAEKTIDYGAATITKKQAVSYDYSNDATWNELKEKVKERETLLKAIKEPLADATSGEMIEPAIKRSTDSYSIIFK